MAYKTQIDRLKERPDPLLTFRWVVKTLPIIDLDGSTFQLDTNFVETFEIPFNNVTSSGIFFGGGRRYFPEFHDVSAISVNFYGDVENKSLKYIWAWKRRVKNFDTGLYSLPTQYKHTVNAVLLDPMGEGIMEASVIGMWPADTQAVPLEYTDGSGRIVYSQNFSVDIMNLKFLR